MKVRQDAAKLFADVGILQKKLQQLEDKVESTPIANKRPRKRLCAKLNRAKVEVSQSIRRCPFRAIKWKEFSREIANISVGQLSLHIIFPFHSFQLKELHTKMRK